MNENNVTTEIADGGPNQESNVQSQLKYVSILNLGSRSMFVSPSLEEARKAFLTQCRELAGQDSESFWLDNLQNSREALRYLGKDGSVVDGVRYAIYEAAKAGIRFLGFSLPGGEIIKECMDGIKAGLKRILDSKSDLGEYLSLPYGSFSIGMNFEMGKDAGQDPYDFQAELMDGYSYAPYELLMKDEFRSRITLSMRKQRTPRVNPAEAAKERLLKNFSGNEIAKVSNSDYKLGGVAWAVNAAMTEPQSKVRKLVFDGIRSAGKVFDEIGKGIANALRDG